MQQFDAGTRRSPPISVLVRPPKVEVDAREDFDGDDRRDQQVDH
jgi:hypothetical protein